eukprot:CAMPEP_0180575186 /NCGR_PEP_ID=MMETSP1037_2-20121125/10752_1 /TAXON_ID=632150 /ORGANISM="Azadinium spinosum, Strain 3D9" /LENGTH=125 /DNA_ID=CAMNT_0022592821 /DNA_START=116 /DNA_END=490 /DNA_ORIENTATION=+
MVVGRAAEPASVILGNVSLGNRRPLGALSCLLRRSNCLLRDRRRRSTSRALQGLHAERLARQRNAHPTLLWARALQELVLQALAILPAFDVELLDEGACGKLLALGLTARRWAIPHHNAALLSAA